MSFAKGLFLLVLGVSFSAPSFAADRTLVSKIDPKRVTTVNGGDWFKHLLVDGLFVGSESSKVDRSEWNSNQRAAINRAIVSGKTVSILEGRFGGNLRVQVDEDNSVSDPNETQALKKRIIELEAQLRVANKGGSVDLSKLSDSKTKPAAQSPIASADPASKPSSVTQAQK